MGGGIPNPLPTRKRYSSSFGHRYAITTGTGSDGSPSSGPERKEIERPSVSNRAGVGLSYRDAYTHLLECFVHE